jgi:hypothetical protein
LTSGILPLRRISILLRRLLVYWLRRVARLNTRIGLLRILAWRWLLRIAAWLGIAIHRRSLLLWRLDIDDSGRRWLLINRLLILLCHLVCHVTNR